MDAGERSAMLGEAMQCCGVLHEAAEQKLAELAAAKPITRKLADAYARSALGLSYDGFVIELRDLSRLLAAISTEEMPVEAAAPRLRGIGGSLHRLAEWMEDLEPLAKKTIRNPADREAALSAARVQAANARRLDEPTERIAG